MVQEVEYWLSCTRPPGRSGGRAAQIISMTNRRHDVWINTMIYGYLQHPDAYAHLLANPVWKEAFDWLRELRPTVQPGTP
jgi:hypothetical protein